MQETVKTNGAAAFDWVGTRPLRPDGVDKVTGRARFGADLAMQGQLVGKVLRSPHPHARIRSIDTTAAAALPGVKAVVTRDDFKDQPSQLIPAGEQMLNYRDIVRNVMAREKALYEGHAVAAVAATSASIAKEALKLIKVDYEVLPHVIDVVEAMKPGAPLLQEDLITAGVEPAPRTPSNIAKRVEVGHGDIETGFRRADLIVERSFTTQPVHQGYIEPHACVASVSEDGQADVWCTTQGHWMVRAQCARLLGWETFQDPRHRLGDRRRLRRQDRGLSGARGPGAGQEGTPAGQDGHDPRGGVPGERPRLRRARACQDRHQAGRTHRRRGGRAKYQAGAFPGSPVQPGAMCAFAPYDIENVKVVGYDVVTNRPKVAAYRAPGAPISEYAVECVVDDIAARLGMDPIELRLKNAAKQGTKAAYGPKLGPVGLVETLEAARAHDHWKAPLAKNQGRGIASGFWFNIGGETSASLQLNEDGTLSLTVGTPDIGGSRASMCMMAAEELGVDIDSIRVQIGDTGQLGFNFLTGGSRATFSSGMATVEAAREVIREACKRAAKLWELPEDAVEYRKGAVRPAGANAGKHAPLTLRDIAGLAGKTGGPIAGYARINAQGAAPSFGTHIADVEVDPETGKVTVVRYTAIQDAGRAIHPSYVEGQYQGGVAQGIGWALNEEYIYGPDGKLQNPGFLDYRVPVASDLPMIDTVIVEVPNPRHPYGVRGVGETPIIPPLAAIANAVADATGVRFADLPMSPPRVLAALDEARARGAAKI